jgi:hypothetical protein
MARKAAPLLPFAVPLAVFIALVLSLSTRAMAQRTDQAGADDLGEEVMVAGHWVIEVRDPDGTLVASREFHNALTGSGKVLLASLLARVGAIGQWMIGLDGSTNTSALCLSDGVPAPCVIVESTNPQPPPPSSPTLTVEAYPEGSLPPPATPIWEGLSLSGTARARRDGDVGSVSTWLGTCGPEISPADCLSQSTGANNFTWADLDAPLPVLAGQTVYARVELTFR